MSTQDESRTAHRYFVVSALAVGVLLLAACGDEGAAPATAEGPPDIAVVGSDRLTFEPETFEMPAGEEITLELSAESGVEHDVTIADAADVGAVAGDGDMDMDDGKAGDLHVVHADAGETIRATFVIDQPGTYDVYCSVPGHREAGMTATVTVTDAG